MAVAEAEPVTGLGVPVAAPAHIGADMWAALDEA